MTAPGPNVGDGGAGAARPGGAAHKQAQLESPAGEGASPEHPTAAKSDRATRGVGIDSTR
eukprot:181514-Alexandrium_andersonii.AAC.1